MLWMSLQVVSDIDDTLMCSGGHFPAGTDTRFPRNCVYPGVLAFYKRLDMAFVDRIWVSNSAKFYGCVYTPILVLVSCDILWLICFNFGEDLQNFLCRFHSTRDFSYLSHVR